MKNHNRNLRKSDRSFQLPGSDHLLFVCFIKYVSKMRNNLYSAYYVTNTKKHRCEYIFASAFVQILKNVFRPSY